MKLIETNRCISFSVLESGFMTNLKETVFRLLTKSSKKERCYYSNLNHLQEEYKSKFSPLSVGYYMDGLLCLVGIQGVILLVFVANRIVAFYKSLNFSRSLRVLRRFIIRKLGQSCKVLILKGLSRCIKVMRDCVRKISLKRHNIPNATDCDLVL